MTSEDIKARVFVLRAFTGGLKAMADKVVDELDRRETLQRDAIKRAMDQLSEDTIEELKEKLDITWDDVEHFKDEV